MKNQNETMTKQRFEAAVRKLTKNERVIAALVKCFETKNFAKRSELGLFPTDHNAFDTVLDWAMKSGWLK